MVYCSFPDFVAILEFYSVRQTLSLCLAEGVFEISSRDLSQVLGQNAAVSFSSLSP